EHRYHPPYDRTRLDEPLEQRTESFVAAETNASRSRLLTLFLVVRPGGTVPAWPPAHDGDAWRIPNAGAGATVTVSATDLTASAASGSVRVPLAT
ncbi:MAG: hypothetical protein OXC31_11000, partial [Spirochaetaceae bacterium]|nr:hypothetical protein [Spirochaetaceae bacterium]